MSEHEAGDRKSEAASPFLITDPDEHARREAENGLKQFDSVIGLVQRYLAERWRFALRISIILGLHRDALFGVHPLAGNFRPSTVKIRGASTSLQTRGRFHSLLRNFAIISTTTGKPPLLCTLPHMRCGGLIGYIRSQMETGAPRAPSRTLCCV